MDFKRFFNEDYFVSKCGKVKNKKGVLLTPQKNKGGYLFYVLSINKKVSKVLAHRMVLIAWEHRIDYIFLTVNHKDGNKENNHIENLEWMTNSENAKHYHSVLKPKKA